MRSAVPTPCSVPGGLPSFHPSETARGWCMRSRGEGEDLRFKPTLNVPLLLNKVYHLSQTPHRALLRKLWRCQWPYSTSLCSGDEGASLKNSPRRIPANLALPDIGRLSSRSPGGCLTSHSFFLVAQPCLVSLSGDLCPFLPSCPDELLPGWRWSPWYSSHRCLNLLL